MQKLRILFLLLLGSCSWFQGGRTPASFASFSSYSLLEKSQFIIDAVATREINHYTCAKSFDSMALDYENGMESLNVEDAKKNGKKILEKSFQARLALRSAIDIYPTSCKSKLQELIYQIRMSEDLVGIYYYGDKQISAQSIDYQKGAIPLYDSQKFNPYHVVTGKSEAKRKFEFKSGDVLISKGISFVSSTISEVSTPKSLYSHLGLVYVDPKNKEIKTIESFIGKGVGIYPIEEALKNESVRYIVLRYKDEKLAAEAATYMYERVSKALKEGKVIDYDYKLDFEDNTKLSCEEVVYDAFKTASKGTVVVPEITSTIVIKNKKLMALAGMGQIPMMMPVDIELDSRFQLLADWSDHRVLRDSWRKDAVIGEMARWLEVYGHKLSGPSSGQIINNPKKKLEQAMAKVQSLGDVLLRFITEADEAHFQSTGRWMATGELRERLDEYRRANSEALEKFLL